METIHVGLWVEKFLDYLKCSASQGNQLLSIIGFCDIPKIFCFRIFHPSLGFLDQYSL